MEKKWQLYLIASIIFVFGIGVGIFLFRNTGWFIQKTNNIKPVREAGYKYINPLLECEGAEDIYKELTPFKAKIDGYVNQIADSNPGYFISMYFRDLNNGPWFGINEKEYFYPASLLKVPLMMAYFKQAETQPDLLTKTFSLSPNDRERLSFIRQNIKPGSELELNKPYSVSELISRMIIYSDNESYYLLLNNLNIGLLNKVYGDFGLEFKALVNPDPQIMVKTYAGFFRILYNASYLNKEYSEKALEILSQSQFKDGLVAGIPANTIVAHKFGERVYGEEESQFHDCGIVYYPNHPYLICVMTRGMGLKKSEEILSQISQIVYSEVENQNEN